MEKILSIFTDIGIKISKGKRVDLLTTVPEDLDYELEQARREGISKGKYIHIDDTGAKVGKENHYTFVSCNEYFTYLVTLHSKNRLSAVSALLGGIEPSYLINTTAIQLFKEKFKSQESINELKKLKSHNLYDKAKFLSLLSKNVVLKKLSHHMKFYLRCFCAIAALRKYREGPVGYVLVSDAAGNYTKIYKRHQFCWIHERRHYKLLTPEVGLHREVLDKYKRKILKLYNLMKKYKVHPTDSQREEIETRFDNIFSSSTSYGELNKLLRQTKKRRKGLLQFLDYPEIPLHNNTSEQDIRENVIKRKISQGTKTQRGAYAWDRWLGLSHTCRKLGISFYDYVKDRFSMKYEILPLAEFIKMA